MPKFLAFVLRTDLRCFALIGFFVFAAYSFMLHSPFKTLDDDFSIVRNADIRELGNIPRMFQNTYFKSDKGYYRPLVNVSYALEYHFFRLNFFFYNLDNVLLHYLNSCLVFWLVLLLAGGRGRALAVAFIFAIHPVHWEAVATIPGRAIILCTFFVLAGLVAFLKSIRENKPGLQWAAVLCYVLGLLCKESAGMMLPVAVAAFLIVQRRPWRSLQALWSLGPFVAVAAGYFIVRKVLGYTGVYHWGSAGEMWLGFVSFLNGVIEYLRVFIMPVDLRFDRGHLIYRDWSEPAVIYTLGVYIAGICVLWFNRRRISSLVWFCLVWFAIELFPVSQLVTSIGVYPGAISLAEHFVYLASVPVFILVVFWAEKIYGLSCENQKSSPWVWQGAAGGVLLFWFLLLVRQNIYASNEFLMLKDSLGRDPRNSRMHYSLGMVYVKSGNSLAAAESFRRAVDIDPLQKRYRISLSRALLDSGNALAAARELEQIVPDPDLAEGLKEGREKIYGKLITDYLQRVAEAPGNAGDRFALGIFYFKIEKYAEALGAFETAWGIDNGRFDALFNVGVTQEYLGDPVAARGTYELLVRKAPTGDLFSRQAAGRLAGITQSSSGLESGAQDPLNH